MVTKLYGYCNGDEIVFSQNEMGRWETIVPNTSARYVLELWAEDAAGNKGYAATLLFSFDSESLCYKVEILDVGHDFSRTEIESMFKCTSQESNANVIIIDPFDTIGVEFIEREVRVAWTMSLPILSSAKNEKSLYVCGVNESPSLN